MASSSSKINTLSDILHRAEKWIDDCLNSHPNCRSRGCEKGLPARIIDVGPADGSKEPYLLVISLSNSPAERTKPSTDVENISHEVSELDVSSATDSTRNIRYVALTYCWGNTQNFLTTRENLESMKDRIPWDKLPQTIKDAITVTRRLGIRYFWVDALCIIQNSPEDWQAESMKMADVYGGAFLTISAALGPDVHHGLTQPPVGPKPQFPLQGDPLYSRAWSLQERILSARILIFGGDQMYWECQDCQQGEDGTQIPRPVSYRLRREPSIIDWHVIVEDYTCRALTKEADKLPALSGLAEVYHQATKYDYLAGLWRQSLPEDLLWWQQYLLYGNRVSRGIPSTYRAPSWSWASLDGNVRFNHFNNAAGYKFIPSAEIVGTHNDPPSSRTSGETNELMGDWICVCGSLLQACITRGEVHFYDGSSAIGWIDLRRSHDTPGGEEERLGEFEWHLTVNIREVWCLLLGVSSNTDDGTTGVGHGLILVPTKATIERAFKRIGVFRAETDSWRHCFQSSDESTVFIF